jgi:hypothetical protein
MLRGFGEEEVDGVIIGPITFPYEFWIDEPRPEYADRNGKRRVTKGNFENDEQAVEWFKTNYPDEYKYGVEMRVWDQ